MTHSGLGFFFCSDNRGKDPRKSKKETYLSGCRKKGKEAILFWRKNVFKSFESEAVKDMLAVKKNT